ncbi:MAG TPA: class I SAM-dependent methyltransferase [Nitrospirae bacterium]|nr:tellurite resistance protein TehB [bacterium BMS3Abin06]HDH10617.1 class I SAM-dependent methyltransferase [Nitrospirota bacterium]HDZ00259.1 class I SAM-dependent methyltransferase [Nitrospirota bacterium]
MKDYYQKHAKDYHDKTFQLDPNSILSPLVKQLAPKSKILDIGCASGRDLIWLSKKGFDVQGLERASELARMARENSGCNVIEADFKTFDFSSLDVDAIVAVGSLVHVGHDRLESVIKSCLRAVGRPGHILMTLKEGQGFKEGSDGRIFALWQENELEEIFQCLQLSIVDFSRQVSKIKRNDIWLGYVVKYDWTAPS